MRKAGYTEQTATKTQAAYFARPEMVAEIERRRKQIIEDHGLTLEWVIERLMRIADSGRTLAKFKKVTADGYLDWDFTNATLEELSLINDMNTDSYSEGRGQQARAVKRFKISGGDPKGALDSLARILGAFNDNLTVKSELSMVERLHAGRARVKRENQKHT
jgi:phage terminase small subunit